MPRVEAWAATVLPTRVNANAVARFGIDASYVVDGAAKRSRFEKGKNGDIWTLLFALKDFRTADIGLAKCSSHIEDSGALAIENDFTYLCDIIGTHSRMKPPILQPKRCNLLKKIA